MIWGYEYMERAFSAAERLLAALPSELDGGDVGYLAGDLQLAIDEARFRLKHYYHEALAHAEEDEEKR